MEETRNNDDQKLNVSSSDRGSDNDETTINALDVVVFILKSPFLVLLFLLKAIKFLWDYAIPLTILGALTLLWLTSTGRLEKTKITEILSRYNIPTSFESLITDYLYQKTTELLTSQTLKESAIKFADNIKVKVTFLTAPQVSFICKVAFSEEAKRKGLMYVNSLPQDECMLFVYESSTLTPFWTKNMRFNIDIIFIDSKLRVIKVFNNLAPCTEEVCVAYAPSVPYNFVVEINGGLAKKYSITPNTKVVISTLK